MKPVFHTLSLAAILLSLNACKTTTPQNPGVGPFDANGNYIEAWADNPPKSRTSAPKDIDAYPPSYSKTEQPPDQSVPIVDLPPPEPVGKIASNSSGSRTSPSKSSPNKSVNSSPRTKTDPDHLASRSSTKSRTSTGSSTKSKSTASTKKPSSSSGKSKPTVTRYTVKRGDSLSSIAARNGTTVSALKSANGLSGDMIRDGRSLVIPRRK